MNCPKCGSSLETYVPTGVERTTWRWKPVRWWVASIAFWLISIIGAGIVARIHGSYEADGTVVILIMLVFACFAAFSDRSWSIPIRIVWVLGIWLIFAVLSHPIALIIVPLVDSSPRPELADRVVSLLAAFPLVVWALRRSKFFVELEIGKSQPKKTKSNKLR